MYASANPFSSLLNHRMVRVLLSYSHDSPAHAERVLALSDTLRSHGVDCHIDQYEPVPAEGWPVWMERQVAQADHVICICTATYHKRFSEDLQPGEGRGVTWEANLIRNELYDTPRKNEKFHVGLDESLIPDPLRGHTHFLMTELSLASPGYESLYRLLTNQPKTTRPELGEIVELKPRERRTPEGAPDLLPADSVEENWALEKLIRILGEVEAGPFRAFSESRAQPGGDRSRQSGDRW